MNSALAEERRTALAAWIVRVAALWIVSGALFKLLWGTPADLPAVLHGLPLSLGALYRLAIAVELAVGLAALLVPSLAAPAVAGLLGFFCALLVVMAWRGDASCGCFGASVSFPPLAMLAIDGVLLVLLLVLRPWRRRPRRRSLRFTPVALVIAGLAALSPWLLDREIAAPASPEQQGALPGYVVLDVEHWIGKTLAETPLGRFLPRDQLPDEGLVVVYRMTCEHCAEELFELAAADDHSRPITLVRIVDRGERMEDHVVQVLPEGPHVRRLELPRAVDWVVTTPVELELEGGVIVSAREGGVP